MRQEYHTVELEFDTTVNHVAAVDCQARPAGRAVKVCDCKQVRTTLVIVVKRTVETIAEKSEIDTGIPCRSSFPAELVVGRSLKITLLATFVIELVDIVAVR